MIITQLPNEILLELLLFLDDKTLVKVVRLVSKYFKNGVDNDLLWKKKFRRLNVYNPLWIGFTNNSWKTNYVSSHLWRRTSPKCVRLADYKRKCIPWLHLEDESLYFARDSVITCRPTVRRRGKKMRYFPSYSTNNFDQLGRFVIKDSQIVAGTLSGHLCLWTIERNSVDRKKPDYTYCAHSDDVHSVSIAASTVITGSRDEHVKFWNIKKDLNSVYNVDLLSDISMGDRVWCMNVEETNQKLLSVGSAACKNDCAPLTIFDIENCTVSSKLGVPARRGAGVSDVKFRDENTIFAAGYDSMIRLYDLRSNKCVWNWFEKYDSNIFSLLTDKNNAVIVGTSQHGRIWFLDLRWRRPIREELYVSTRNSPVYSLATNTKSLFVGLDSELHEFYV